MLLDVYIGTNLGPLHTRGWEPMTINTSSILIGGEGGAGLSSLHTTLEGPTEYVNARWMWSIRGFLHGIKCIMFHGHFDYFQKAPHGSRPNTRPGDHGTPNPYNRWFILFYHVWGPTWMKIHWNITFGGGPNHIWLHTTLEGPCPHYMILEVSWDGLWTLSFGLSHFHGHGSWLVCEVALITPSVLSTLTYHQFHLLRAHSKAWWFRVTEYFNIQAY